MLAVRVYLRIAMLLALVCALVVSGAAWAGSWLPSGGVIYFSQITGNTNAHIFDPLRSVRYALTDRQNIYTSIVPSPHDRRVAFAQLAEVRVFDFDTMHISTIYTALSGVVDAVYSWSPSGRYLGFRSGGELLKYDFMTGKTSPLIGENRGSFFNDSFPVWSPDETQIAFVSSLRDASTWQGYLVNADGSDLRRITRVDVCQFYAPSWSPAGRLLVFNAQCETTPTIFLFNAETGRLRALSDLDVPTWEPVWSPDGTRLLLIAGVQNRRIYTADADGTHLRFLTGGDFAYWSPDGESILFSSPSGDLYTIGADGSNLQRLTFSDGKPFLLAMGWSR